MANPRNRLAERICDAIGPAAHLLDRHTGWPSFISCQTSRGEQRIALYAGPIGRMYRDSRPDDYRVQNPGSDRPVVDYPDSLTIAVGWWEDGQPVVVACDPERWRTSDRISQMFKLSVVHAAQLRGWDSYRNTDGDVFHAFRPELFPAYVEAVIRNVDLNDLALTRQTIQEVVGHYLYEHEGTVSPSERARAACTRLVRDAAFSRDVVAAYGGRCVVCGLNLKLAEAAHILPVASSGSMDEVANGLCLCPNHHRAFDSHRIWIHPDTGDIRFHASLMAGQLTDADRRLVDTTFSPIRPPHDDRFKPNPDMFRRRYAEYQLHYSWAEGE